MSQQPNSDPHGYNPYEPHPPNPNTPGAQGREDTDPTQPSPSRFYPPGMPPPNPNYEPYPNPYAPQPPWSGTAPDSYANPPTPPRPEQAGIPANPYDPYDTYDPYAPTLISRHAPPPGPPAMPGPGLRNVLRLKNSKNQTILAAVLALLVLLGGIIFWVAAYNHNQASIHANATATAQTRVRATAHAQATVYAQQTAVASTYPFSNKPVLNDPLVDNSKGFNWDDDRAACFFSGSAYHVVDKDANTSSDCAATNTDFTNFTFEAEMVIKQGNDSIYGGLIFRANKGSAKDYALEFNDQGKYGMYIYVDRTGSEGNARTLINGKDKVIPSFHTDLGATNLIAVEANNDQISFYVNKQLVTTVTDSTYSRGQIGFFIDNYNATSQNSEVVFTNAKVWQL